MKTGTFMDLISIHYKEITKSFKSKSTDNILDEDAFNDAFIKCATHFGNEILDYDYVVKYFFTAYKNTKLSNINKENNISKELFDIEVHDLNDEGDDYNEYANIVYKDVMKAVEREFSEEEMNIYRLYKYHKCKKKDIIEAGYDCDDFENKIDEIHKFVKKYCREKFKRVNK